MTPRELVQIWLAGIRGRQEGLMELQTELHPDDQTARALELRARWDELRFVSKGLEALLHTLCER
jgi:hypothetical protein